MPWARGPNLDVADEVEGVATLLVRVVDDDEALVVKAVVRRADALAVADREPCACNNLRIAESVSPCIFIRAAVRCKNGGSGVSRRGEM
jgi:hypothetical protein